MRGLLAALWFSAAVATSPWTQSSPKPELEREVRNALAAAGFDVGAITVTSRDTTVVLHGEVRDARQKLLAVEAAFGVAAVREVETALELRNSVTPEVEEEVWFALMQEGLDAGVDQILVEEGIARVDAPEIGEEGRERLARILERVQGVRSVTFEGESVVADAPLEQRAEPIETLPPNAEPPAVDAPGVRPEPAETRSEPPPSAQVREPDPPTTDTSGSTRAPEPVGAEAPVPETTPEARASEDVIPSGDAERLGALIVQQILDYGDYTVFDHIQVAFEQGVVRLAGFVTDASKKDAIEKRVASVSGSVRLENEIHVLLESSSDEALRKRLFDRIYGDPTFAELAESRNPPIHIIVEGGGVILTGVVLRRIDASVAETIARNTFGVRRVESRIRVASTPSP